MSAHKRAFYLQSLGQHIKYSATTKFHTFMLYIWYILLSSESGPGRSSVRNAKSNLENHPFSSTALFNRSTNALRASTPKKLIRIVLRCQRIKSKFSYFLFEHPNILRTADELSQSNFFLGSITPKTPEMKKLVRSHPTGNMDSFYFLLHSVFTITY